ncbi:MAG: hypothetical protein ABIA63_00905, partial [bacterium]
SRDEIRIKAGFIQAADKKSMSAGSVAGSIDDFFNLEKKLAFSIIDKLGLKITNEERKNIQTIKTENLLAFMAYSRGLDALDRGDFKGALEAFTEAKQIDPGFKEAADGAEAMEDMEQKASPQEKETEPVPEPVAEKAPVEYQGSAPGGLLDRFSSANTLSERMSNLANGSFMPEIQLSSKAAEAILTENSHTAAGEAEQPRTDFSDSYGLDLGWTKKVPIEINIPE